MLLAFEGHAQRAVLLKLIVFLHHSLDGELSLSTKV